MYNFPCKKIQAESIGSIDFGAYFLEIIDRGQSHHFFINHVPHSEKCIILGTGAVNKKKVSIPYFDRMSWYNLFTVSSIYYFDSTLFFDDVNLGWLYGTNDRWYMEDVANIIIKLLVNMNISPENSICVGSSGGDTRPVSLQQF